jgi:glycosyltransferase involved in cell wall biosynthesis
MSINISYLFGDEYISSFYAGMGKPRSIIVKAYIKRLISLLEIKNYDLVWIEKELFPWLPEWGERYLKSLNIPYVVDYDDAIFHKYDLHQNRLIRTILGDKIDNVIRNAALVIVGNDYLADRAKRAGNKNIVVLPTVVDVDRYSTKKLDSESLFTIGWVGTPNTTRFLFEIAPVLQNISKKIKFKLNLLGGNSIQIDGVDVETIEWNENTESSIIQTFSCGIMPIPDYPFERGKCGYKLIQYMACGKPVVASPVGVNCKIVDHGKTGFLASTHIEWCEALINLMKDRNKCLRMGEMAREKVVANYSLQSTAPYLYSLFKGFESIR